MVGGKFNLPRDILEKVKDNFFYIITGGGTISFGFTATGSAAGTISVSRGIVIDSKGNIHYQIVGAGGGGIPSLSGGVFFSHLNAPDLNQIGKTGGQFGGSIGEGLSMGIDAITAENKHLLS